MRYLFPMITEDTLLDITCSQEIYTVSQLNRSVRDLLEEGFPALWVEGEISNCKRPSSGHLYFSLKDENAQVRCAMFRNRQIGLGFVPKDGIHVLAKAQISLYEERGDYQLIIEYLEETGAGKLRRAFEQLKQRLANEGLFDAQHKKSLPTFPKQIGVITSATGAAIRDILTVLKRRLRNIPVIIYPTPVQGAEAAPQIAAAIQIANQRKECDVLMVARGGGSLEDLWPFNEEIVARAIYASEIPIVSGVGHEIDFTISDFVADQRAPTPSAAAALVTPDGRELLQNINLLMQRLHRAISNELRHHQQTITNLKKLLQHPGRKLQDQAQQLDYLERNLIKATFHLLHLQQTKLDHTYAKLERYQPQQLLTLLTEKQKNLTQRMQVAMQNNLNAAQNKFVNICRALDTISPLNTLQRGYAIVSKNENILRNSQEVNVGDKVTAQLAKGQLNCIVENIIK